jgi:hypothetical protein
MDAGFIGRREQTVSLHFVHNVLAEEHHFLSTVPHTEGDQRTKINMHIAIPAGIRAHDGIRNLAAELLRDQWRERGSACVNVGATSEKAKSSIIIAIL